MKIGIIGSGRIGGSIGEAWISTGHDVMFGIRNPKVLPGKVGTVEEAVQHGEVILFAIPGSAVVETAKHLELAGKVVIDATNGGGSSEQSVVNALSNMLPQSYIYKAFNTLGYENFQNPVINGERPDLLFVGPEHYQNLVAGLIRNVGLNPLYLGDLDKIGLLDTALSLWLGMSRHLGRHLAFRILYDKNIK